MKIITSSFKSLLLLLVSSSFFLTSNAQRGRDRQPQNNRQQRVERQQPQRNFGDNQRIDRQQPQRNFGNSQRIDRQPPVRYNQQPSSRVTDRRQNSYNQDRRFQNNRPGVRHYGGNNNVTINRYHYNNRPPRYNAYNPSWRYGALPRRNTVINVFPFSYQTINYGGCGYRYYNGSYYRPYNNAYIVVAPPIGLYLNTLPFGYRRLVVNDYPYYYYNGTYYDQYQDNYRVVAPPLGAIVESIPEGYETVVIDGETYYTSDGVQYKPIVQENGEIWYEVIKVN